MTQSVIHRPADTEYLSYYSRYVISSPKATS